MDPFLGSVAVGSGRLTRRGLARHHTAVYRDVYVPRDVELTARIRAEAAWLATGATLGGMSAAAVFGTKWIDPGAPAEIIRADRHSAAGIVARSWSLVPDEVCMIGGVDATTPARTAFDIGRTRSPEQAIPIIDALMNATRVSPASVAAIAAAHPGTRGGGAAAWSARPGRRWRGIAAGDQGSADPRSRGSAAARDADRIPRPSNSSRHGLA